MKNFPYKVFFAGIILASLIASLALNYCFWNGKLQLPTDCKDFYTTLANKGSK